MKYRILAILFAAILAVPAQADTDRGTAAYLAGNFDAAQREFHASAKKGDARAQYSLGLLYLRGQGVIRNPLVGIQWLRRAANAGDGEARMVLGDIYRRDQPLTKDYVKSYMWLTLALGRIRGPKREFAYRLRAHVKARMTPGQVATAEKLARDWKAIDGS